MLWKSSPAITRFGALSVRLVFAFFIFLLFASSHSANAAFGISPPFLNADHLVKGATYVQTVYLVQDRPDEDLTIKAELKVPDAIRSWIEIDKGYSFIIPKGVRQFPVAITVKVPKDAGLGSYSGNLSFTSVPGQTGQVTIALGVQVAINLNVGEGIFKKFSVALIKFLDVEEGWEPRVYVKFNNEGNVAEYFDGATFELYDQFNSVRLAFIQKADNFEETPPFTIKEYTLDFPTDFHLGVGQYWGVVKLYQNKQLIKEEKGIFRVLERGALSSPTAVFLQNLSANWKYYVFGLLVFAASLFIWRKRKKNRK